MEGTSWNLHHGSYLMEHTPRKVPHGNTPWKLPHGNTPWKLLHGTYIIKGT